MRICFISWTFSGSWISLPSLVRAFEKLYSNLRSPRQLNPQMTIWAYIRRIIWQDGWMIPEMTVLPTKQTISRSDEKMDNTINLALRLWLKMDIRARQFGGVGDIQYNDNSSLGDLIEQRFQTAKKPAGEVKVEMCYWRKNSLCQTYSIVVVSRLSLLTNCQTIWFTMQKLKFWSYTLLNTS